MPTIMRVGGGAGGGNTIVVTVDSGATVTATNGSKTVSGVSVNGTCTLKVPEAGTWTVTATKDGMEATATVTVTDNYSIEISFLPPVGTALNNCSWQDISMIAASGLAANYFAVGDRKAVTVRGTVGTQSISGTYYVYILGFNHNGATNTIDFGTFKTALSGGSDICLIDGSYNDYKTDGTKLFNMNHSSNTNSGGWKGCDLRYDVLGSTNTNDGNATATTATSPVSGTLMAALPSELRAVMKPMTIYTDNTGGGTDTASNVTSSVDYLPLLAEYEIFGTRRYANSSEKNYQAQYAYYSAGNSKVKYRHSATGSTADWWERSPLYNTSNGFCLVDTNGYANAYYARYSSGLATAFRV